MSYIEHKHSEYEEGMLQITISYSVIARRKGSKYFGAYEFHDDEEEKALKKYAELEKDEEYECVVFSEVQHHNLVKKCMVIE